MNEDALAKISMYNDFKTGRKMGFNTDNLVKGLWNRHKGVFHAFFFEKKSKKKIFHEDECKCMYLLFHCGSFFLLNAMHIYISFSMLSIFDIFKLGL